MGDTQLGGDPGQTARMEATEEYIRGYQGTVDEAWHVGDLGSSSTAYEFLAAYKALSKAKGDKMPEGVVPAQVEFQRELQTVLDGIVAEKRAAAAKYVMGEVLRAKKGWREKYPEAAEMLKRWARDERVTGDAKLASFVSGEGEAAVLDMYKMVTGKDKNFLQADEAAMIEEMSRALTGMARLAGESGRMGVVPGNQEISNWKRVMEKVLPAFQGDVDIQREPSYHEVSPAVGLFALPYEYDKEKFNAKALAGQASGKKAVIIGMHASPLLRGLAETIREPLSAEEEKSGIIEKLGIAERLDVNFEEADSKIQNYLLASAGGFNRNNFKGKALGEAVEMAANRLYERGRATYERRQAWDARRKETVAKHGTPDRTPGSQTNPMHKQFRELVRNLPDSVETIVVPWGHLHATSEKAMANHPWFKYDEEVRPQSFVVADPITKKHRTINFVYLPTAAVAIFECHEDGHVDIRSLKQAVEEGEK